MREKLTLAWRGATARVPDFMFVEEPRPTPIARIIAPAMLAHPGPKVEQDPVDLCLAIWKAWMAGDADRDLGAKTMRGLSGEGDGHGVDLHEAQQANDVRIAQATNAMIDSLPRIQVWAIQRMCSLTTAWNFPNASWFEVAAEAREGLRTKLRKNIATAVLF